MFCFRRLVRTRLPFFRYYTEITTIKQSKLPKLLFLGLFVGVSSFVAYRTLNTANANDKITETVPPNHSTHHSTTRKWYYYSGKHPDELSKTLVFSGSHQRDLAQKICDCLGIELGKATVTKFNDGESSITINETVRGKNAYIVQSAGPSSDSIIELLLMITTLNRANAETVTAVIPYYGYGRRDVFKKHKYSTHFGAADLCNMLVAAGVDRVIALDLHAGQIQGFFPSKIAVDNLSTIPIAAAYFSEKGLNDFVVVAPCPSAVVLAKDLVGYLLKRGVAKAEMAMVLENLDEKRSSVELIGDVKGRDVIIVNDILDNGLLFYQAASILKANGAKKIYGYATHGVLRKDCINLLNDSAIDCMTITDSLSINTNKYDVMTIAPILSEVIYRLSTKKTISELFY